MTTTHTSSGLYKVEPQGGFISVGNSTVTPLSGGATFTGVWEDIFQFSSISLIATTDVAGTLYADFSIDGITTDRTVQLSSGLAAISGIHSLIPVAEYYRVRVVNGAGAQATCRVQSVFNVAARIAQPTTRMSQTLNSYSDVLSTRAVTVGSDPVGDFVNIKADGLGFQTATLLTNAETYDSGILSLVGYTQVQTHVLSDKNGTITIDFIRDLAGTDVLRTLTIPHTGSTTYQVFAAPAFTPHVRYRFTCDETGQTDFYFDTKFLTKPISGQILGVDAFISPLMVANLNRNIIVGQDGASTFHNVTTVETSNDDGTYHSLQVVSGARPSELFGRVSKRIVVDAVTVSSVAYTVTSGKTLYVTDIILTVENTGTGSSGSLKIEDGIIAAQPVVLPVLIAESGGNTSQTTTITHSFEEPLSFSTGIWLNEVSGTLTISGVIEGYEE